MGANRGASRATKSVGSEEPKFNVKPAWVSNFLGQG
jgi:hypothetical protein